MPQNASDLSPSQFAEEIKRLVKGAARPTLAEERLKAHFASPYFFIETGGDERHFVVHTKQKPNDEVIQITCPR